MLPQLRWFRPCGCLRLSGFGSCGKAADAHLAGDFGRQTLGDCKTKEIQPPVLPALRFYVRCFAWGELLPLHPGLHSACLHAPLWREHYAASWLKVNAQVARFDFRR